MAEIINIKKYQKTDITKKNYKEIPLISQINIALYHLYDNPLPDVVLLHHPEGACTKNEDIDSYLTRLKGNLANEPITSVDELILNHFIVTQEGINENSIILGFFQVVTHTYTRYKIKDIRKLCELLRVAQGDFSQILGKASPDDFSIYNTHVDRKKYLSEISSLISNASFTPIQDVHILKMLECFNINGGILCPLPSKTQ